MDAIKKENPLLKWVLLKVYARGNLDPTSLGGLIDLVGNIALGDAKVRSADVLGHVFEYFLGEFALVEGKGGAVLHPLKHCSITCRAAGTLQRQSLRPLLRLQRYVCPVGKVCRRSSGKSKRYFHLWSGEQPDHMAIV